MKRAVLSAAAAAVLSISTMLCLAQDARPARGARPADAPAPAQPGGPAVVLGDLSVWRSFSMLKPPVFALDAGLKPVSTPNWWLNGETAAAPEGWEKAKFDDTAWVRGAVRAFAKTPYLARLHQRARFEVTDPAAVKDLKLSLAYYGGVIVYVNGEEVARDNLPKGRSPELATAYGPEAFVGDDGKVLPSGWVVDQAQYRKNTAARERKLDVEIPTKALQKGVNVVAVETVRAPYHKIVEEKKVNLAGSRETAGRGSPYDLSWNTCELRRVALTAASGAGLVPNSARPAEMQVWNSDLLTPDYASDWGDRCEPLRPMAVFAVRNGYAHGKVVVGSAKAIEGLKAVCGELKQGNDAIPAAEVSVRYGASWGGGNLGELSEGAVRGAALLDALLTEPNAVFNGGPTGTVVPIWLTVHVPAGAKAGAYKGELTLSAANQKPIVVPVSVEVGEWKLPDAADRRSWIELIQSPDTLVQEYGVTMWSPQHFELIGQSLRYIGQIGSRVAYVPLIAQTNAGNAESMVRWVKKGNDYEFDFTVMDKYLDLVQKNMGKPKFTVFTSWEVYLAPPKSEVTTKEGDSSYVQMEKSWQAARWAQRDKGPAVTTLDPATGKTDMMFLPRYEDPASRPLWARLFAAIRERLAKRGWVDTMRLGMASDDWPTKEQLTTLEAVSGGLGWVLHTHGGNRVGVKMSGIGQVDYTAYVWNVEFAGDPAKGRTYGWKGPNLYTQFRRFGALNTFPLGSLLYFEEVNITGKQAGIGRIGADNWAAFKDKSGKRNGWPWNRYLQSLWHSLNLSSHMLLPGPTGPVASNRYEVLREGLQECEARIAIEAALTDPGARAKLGPELADRAQKHLDERLALVFRAGSNMSLTGRDYASGKMSGDSYGASQGHFWVAGAGWQERAKQLYALAAEVAKKTGQK